MMIKLWTEASILEKARILLLLFIVFMVVLFYFFPSAFIRADLPDLYAQCEAFDAKFTGKFAVVNGEAIAVCEVE